MQAWLKTRIRNWQSHSSVQSIGWLLGLLIALFFAGMLLLSHLNLDYSQQAMSELRRDQIEDVFSAGLTRIDARQVALEHHTANLALMGETFHRLARGNDSDSRQREQLRDELETALQSQLENFNGASGAGIWFEPGILAAPGETYSPYFIDHSGAQTPTRTERSRQQQGFRGEPWFRKAFGENWSVENHRPGTRYWSPVYYDLDTERAVLTLAIPMLSSAGELIGVVTTDWASDQIIDLVSRVEVTDNSFSFLNDRNNRNLSSLSQGEDSLLQQKIIDAILAENLTAEFPHTASPVAVAPVDSNRLKTGSLSIEGRLYELYYAATPAGMVYGAGVPRDEIDQVLLPMRNSNYRILTTTGSVLLGLSLFLIYRIVLLMRELQASYTDPLTGLPNRARLIRDLQGRDGASLMVLNLDRFKEINSLFGNDCGDQVLLEVSRHLQAFIKDPERPLEEPVYRLAGDEFALIGPVQEPGRLSALAAELNEFMQHQRIEWQEQSLGINFTLGIACCDREDAGDQLVGRATIALRQAREQGRNDHLYDARNEVELDYERNLYWAKRLREALEQNQILPHFQPIYDNREQRIAKYECLVRMTGASKGVVSAGRFLDIANKLRLDRQITRIMVEKSFAQFRHEPYQFSINLSYADLIEPDILNLILDQLRSSDIGQRVIFEILESDGLDNYNDVLFFIEQVKPFGCQIAIDDFGTGYSNFEHLLRLRVDMIKIDGTLIQHLHEDETALKVTRGIVQFARDLGIRTVAEFVHNAAVQRQVEALGIDYSQGALFGMPSVGPIATD